MKNKLIKSFRQCGRTTNFGEHGTGKDCIIVGNCRMSFGENCNIGYNTEIICYETENSTLIFGNSVRLSPRCRITCAGSIEINDNVLLGPEVFITDHNHGMNPEIFDGYAKQKLIIKNVYIGEGSWIGQRAIILPGVRIGKHCIIGAGSIVTKSIPDYSLAVGNPARIIKKYNTEKHIWEKV